MLNILLFGPPGAGKGTQAEFLVKEFDLCHLSTGDLLRTQIEAMTPLGIEAKKFMDRGELAPDEIVIGMIKGKLDECPLAKGFIFDGFPRTVAQAEALDQMLGRASLSIAGLIALEVDKQELIDRLLERGKTSGRSDDADVSIIENRINVYNQKTAPVMNYYKEQGKFFPVKGIGSITEIAVRLAEVVSSFQAISA